MTTDTTPAELWRQAGGGTPGYSQDRYRELLVEHGHLVPRQPGDDGRLPCGWPGPRREGFDPEGHTDDPPAEPA